MEILEVIRQLRGLNGCPWNKKQKTSDLLQALTVELSELETAVKAGAVWEICEELGDVLFNLVSLVECYHERRLLSLTKVDQLVSRKMISRHPYVFDNEPDPSPELAKLQWSKAKIEEAEAQFRSRIGVQFGYNIFEVADRILNDLSQLRYCIVKLAGIVNIIDSDSMDIPKILSSEKGCRLIVLGRTPDFLLLQTLPKYKLISIQGFSTGRIDPDGIYNEIVNFFNTNRIEAILFPSGSARLDSS